MQGVPKSLVANIYDYYDIWERLDDKYDDEDQVVEIITDQILHYKNLQDTDMDGFIGYVDLVERANYDLSAHLATNVLSNSVTISIIIKKCPDWVRMHLTREMSLNKPAREEEFNFILKQLIELRKQARKLSKYANKKDKPQENRPRGQGSANTTQGGQVATANTQPCGGGVDPSSGNPAVSGTTNAAGATSTFPSTFPNKNSSWKCPVFGCTYANKHLLAECRTFKKLDVDSKAKIVVAKKLCVLCFNYTHRIKDCPRKSSWKPCDIGGCGKWHSRMLHGASVPGLVLAIPAALQDNSTTNNVLLLIQPISSTAGEVCNTFWDHGSSTALVTYQFAKKAGLEGKCCRFELSGVGDKTETYDTKLFIVPLKDRDGNVHNINAFGIDKITSASIEDNIQEAIKEFPNLHNKDIQIPRGEVDLLVGMSNVNIMPTKVETQGGLALFTSVFGSGWLLGGATGGAGGAGYLLHQANKVSHRESKLVQMDFLSSEAYGVDIPRRCGTCKSCKECKFTVTQINHEEGLELEAIQSKLFLDVENQKWTAEYPTKQDPSVLKNNFSQAFACMASTERRLEKRNQLHTYNEQFNETVERGVFKEISKEELSRYSGPVNYITIVEAYKPGPHSTTPLRLCMNSSLKYQGLSLNDILMKGPASLTDIMDITIGFRSHVVAFVKDLSKFYQSVDVEERDQHLRRVVWRQGDTNKEPVHYKTCTVNFGDKPAGCIAQCALRNTAKMYREIDPVAADKIVNDTYVDDNLSGAETIERAKEVSVNMEIIATKGGFKYKETIMSGDICESSEPRKVLGLGWDPAEDTIFVGTHVNVSAKKKGIKELPDIEIEELVEKFPAQLTRRMIWRVIMGQYDILGLISVFTIKLKLVMKRITEEAGGKLVWDEAVSEDLRGEFLEILEDLLELKKLRFPRSVVPKLYDAEVKPSLLVLSDGSQKAYCALVYVRFKLLNGDFQCRLVAGKTRVAPTKKISVPRMELMGAVTAVRLAQTVLAGLRFEIQARHFFTDASAALGMIRGQSGSFLEFVGTRVGEIRSKSDVENEWSWIPTDENLADLGTRTSVKPEMMGPDSEYQNGKRWMNQSKESWPSSTIPGGQIPQEELIPAARVHAGTHSVKEPLIDLKDFSSLSRVTNRLAWTAKAVESFKFKAGKILTLSSMSSLQGKALNFLLFEAQASVRVALKNGELDTLRPMFKDVEGFGGLQLVVTSGRLGKGLVVGYDKENLPLLKCTERLATLFMKEAHEIDHSGADRSLQRSRQQVWIIQGARLAKVIVKNCFTCKQQNKILQKQIMAPIHESRLPPTPPFFSTAVDLFGPIKIKDSVKRRTSKECWGVLFCCTVTSAVHLEVSEDYSVDSFLLCLRRFFNFFGTPSRIQCDPGTQLVAAASLSKTWVYEKIEEWINQRGIEWVKIPTASQHFNGCAEALIKVTKKQLSRLMENRIFTKGELDALFSDVQFIVNSRPLMIKAGSDTLSGGPITPLHLLWGRSTQQVPEMNFDTKASLTKRCAFLDSVRREFWDKWFAQVFPHLVPSYRWKKEYRNVQEGDVVLMCQESKLKRTYKLAKVTRVPVDKDGKVRRVFLKYFNVDGKKKYRDGGYPEMETERSIHNLVVVHPADWEEEDVSRAVTEDLAHSGNA